MDHIRKSNLLIRSFLTQNPTQSWLTAQTYEQCALAVVMSSLSKKFEEPNDATSAIRRQKAWEDFMARNSKAMPALSNSRRILAMQPHGFSAMTLMGRLRGIMAGWFRGATFSLSDGGFGPGEVFTSLHGKTSALSKMNNLEVVPKGIGLLKKAIRRNAATSLIKEGCTISVCTGNRFSTVRKTNEKDRPICMEGAGSMLLQKSVGAMLRRVYTNVTGFALDDTQLRHRKIVEAGNHEGIGVATIDLSAASDSISMLLCSEILPPWVFELIDSCRAPLTVYTDGDGNDHVVPLHIVSSMGNGFTFELLTLICAAVCKAAGCTYWSTYGDDIICDTEHASIVMDYLELLGFDVNRDKTCVGIPQLESCGAFSFDGVEILRYEMEWAETEADLNVNINKLVDLLEFYTGLHDGLTALLRPLVEALITINKDALTWGPNHNCKVDGSFARMPHWANSHSETTPLPAWCVDIAVKLHYNTDELILQRSLIFRSKKTPVRKPSKPMEYLFTRFKLNAPPDVYVRGEGEWVWQDVLVHRFDPMVNITRARWNAMSTREKQFPGCIEVATRLEMYTYSGLPRIRPILP